MNIPGDLKFTQSDEWVRIENNLATIGITDYAQDQLSDIVFVEILVSEGDIAAKGDTFATIESVKAASDVYLPLSGKVISVNENLSATPELLNSDPYGNAWLVRIELNNPAEINALVSPADYEQKIQTATSQ